MFEALAHSPPRANPSPGRGHFILARIDNAFAALLRHNLGDKLSQRSVGADDNRPSTVQSKNHDTPLQDRADGPGNKFVRADAQFF